MSGPKVSFSVIDNMVYYSLSEKQKLDISLKSIAVCIEKLEYKINEVLKYIEIVDPIIEQLGENQEFLEELNQFVNKSKEMLNEARTVNRSMSAIKANEITQRQINYYETLDSKASRFERKVRHIKRVGLIKVELCEDNEINEGMKGSFYLSFIKIDHSFDNLKKNINSKLFEVENYELSEELVNKFEFIRNQSNEIKDGQYLHNFYQMVIIPFVKECETYNKFYEKNISHYVELQLQYEVLCRQLELKEEKQIFSLDAICFYEKKIAEMKKQYNQSRVQEYINQSVNEAMLQMGYSLVGEKDSIIRNKTYKNELYQYSEGTVVNVTYSNDGQISMELGGIDSEDRLPTQEESRELVLSMENFCSDYSKIEKILKTKGIGLKHISLLPPDEQFAQIINVSDYEMKKDLSKFETNRQVTEQLRERHIGE